MKTRLLLLPLLPCLCGSAFGSSIGADISGQVLATTATGFSVESSEIKTFPALGLGALSSKLPGLTANATSTLALLGGTTSKATALAEIMGSVTPHSLHAFAEGITTRSTDGTLNAFVEADITAAWTDVITVAANLPVGTLVTLEVTAHFNSSLLQVGRVSKPVSIHRCSGGFRVSYRHLFSREFWGGLRLRQRSYLSPGQLAL